MIDKKIQRAKRAMANARDSLMMKARPTSRLCRRILTIGVPLRSTGLYAVAASPAKCKNS